MLLDEQFLLQPKAFWANVRSIGQTVGYTQAKRIKVPTVQEVTSAYDGLGLRIDHIYKRGKLTTFGDLLFSYFEFRASVLNEEVEPLLMSAAEAKALYDKTLRRLSPTCPLPMNKQKGAKQAPAFLTGLVNMLIEAEIGEYDCDFNPSQLTTLTSDGVPLRTLARRVDGAFPSVVNPTAIWEIKEYYYTTTFGSRVADGVYETLLDGLELEELRENEGVDVKHYLFVDAYDTWWSMGKSYLCRMIDMQHMGYVNEVLFGCEVVDRVPYLVREWIDLLENPLPGTPEDVGKAH